MIKTIIIVSVILAYSILALSIHNVNRWGLEIDCQGKPVSFEVVPHCGDGWNN